MNALQNTRTILTGAAAAMLVAFAIVGNASATTRLSDISSCKADSAGKVVKCCDRIVRKKGKLSIAGESVSCNRVVSCKSYVGGQNACFVKLTIPGYNDNNKTPGEEIGGGKNYNTKP